MSIITTDGTIAPEAKRVMSQHGNVWYGVSDGFGGWYNPERDAWIATPYTFASLHTAEDWAKRLVAMKGGKQ